MSTPPTGKLTNDHGRRDIGVIQALMSIGARPADLHVVAVFQDAEWARRGLEALVRDGFTPGTLSAIGMPSPGVAMLFSDILVQAPRTILLRDVGTVSAAGPLLSVLEGEDEGLSRRGLDGDPPAGRVPAPRRTDLRAPSREGRCARFGRERGARR